MQQGLTEPSVPTPDVGPPALHDVDGIALYPVWPLPAEGYVLGGEAPQLVVA